MTKHTFEGKKIDALIKRIEDKYQDKYKITSQKEMRRNAFLFWLKKYEVEIEVVEEKEVKVGHLHKNKHVKAKSKFNDKKKQDLLDMLREESVSHQQSKLENEDELNINRVKKEKIETENKKNEVSKAEEKAALSEKRIKKFRDKLIESEVNEEIVEEIINEVKNKLTDDKSEEEIEKDVLSIISDKLNVTGKIDLDNVNIVALIGPTGVGKTTTIAKIAGYMVDNGKKVGLITTDVFRIGATEQLQIYANIIEAEMIPVSSPEELEAAIGRLKYEFKVDQILIDTVGRSPLDKECIDDVKEYLSISQPDHVGLALSSTQKSKDIKKILENFEDLTIQSLVFTKLDETTSHGVLLNAVIQGKKPISFVTNGQNVPYDIYQAEEISLAKKILNGVDEFGSSIFTS